MRHLTGTKPIFDPAPWLAAQAAVLAEVSFALGRLDGALAQLDPEARAGAITRMALTEIEAMLWAQGTPLRRDEIGRDLMDARAGADIEAMRLARWGLRRLEGQGDATDLRAFLGLHRSAAAVSPAILSARATGDAFDADEAEFKEMAAALAGLSPLARAPALRMVWRICALSAPELLVEPAVWTARDMAVDCGALRFVPTGRQGRAVWIDGGDADGRLSRHLAATLAGLNEARRELQRVSEWRARAHIKVAGIKGGNPPRAVEALAAHPVLSAPMLEAQAGISRDTAERLLARLQQAGLAREITGGQRFRLWTLAG